MRRALLVSGVVVAALALVGFGDWLGSRPLAAGRPPSLASGTGAASGLASGAASGLPAGAGPFGSCCGGSRAAAAASPSALRQAALDAYRAGTGDQSTVEAKVTDYGCHVQADIYRDGQRVRSYVLRAGQWEEIK